MVKEKINTLAEQTSYLIEKQEELKGISSEAFAKMLSRVDDKLKTVERDSGSEVEADLKAICDFISGFSESYVQNLDEDIEFLNEQLVALKEITNISDEEKAQELAEMIIDKEEELLSTQKFKEEVSLDMQESKGNLQNMSNDVINALEEDKIHELKLLLEAAEAEQEEDDEEEDDLDEEECSECDDEGECCEDKESDVEKCTDCSSCSESTSCCGGGVDIFEEFAKLDKKVEEDKE